MSEEAALGHGPPCGERADAQSLQADLTCEGHRFVEDQSARLLAFSHLKIIVRTFVICNYLFFFGELAIYLHIWVVRSIATLWRNPDDVLGRVLDVAGLAVNAVLRVDLEAVGTVAVFHEFVYARRAVAAFGSRVFREVQGDGNGGVLENQVAGLVLLVVRIGDEYRGEAI